MQREEYQSIDLASVNEIEMDPSIFICPVCFKVMEHIDKIRECKRCQKLFCKSDYLKLTTKNVCPLCKMSPWQVSDKIHPIYAEMFNNLTYHCNFCKELQTATYLQLKTHLEQKHNKLLQHKWILNDYSVLYADLQIANFEPLQNVYMNYKLERQQHAIWIGDEGYDNFSIRVKGDQMRGIHTQYRKFRMISKESKSIQKKVNYFVWEIHMDGKDIMYAMPIQQILQAGYQKYEQQPIKSEILFDLGDSRYRVSFSNMVQLNTSTGFTRNIKRLVIAFK